MISPSRLKIECDLLRSFLFHGNASMKTALEYGFGLELFADVDLRRLAVICLEAHYADPLNDDAGYFFDVVKESDPVQAKVTRKQRAELADIARMAGAEVEDSTQIFRSAIGIVGDAEQATELYAGGPGWGGIDNLRPQFSKFHVNALRAIHDANGGGCSFPPVADYVGGVTECRSDEFPDRCGGVFAMLFAGKGFPEWQAREMLEVDFLDGHEEQFKAETWKYTLQYARMLKETSGRIF